MKFLKTKKGILVGILSALVVGLVLWWFFAYVAYAPEEEAGNFLPTKELEISGTTLTVEIAKDPEDRARGLSGRKELAEGRGMFFVFEGSAFHSFWMKDMNFPIDILWIGDSFKVVDIEKNVSPDSYPESFRPGFPAKYVLEVNAGFVDKHNIQEGDEVDIRLGDVLILPTPRSKAAKAGLYGIYTE